MRDNNIVPFPEQRKYISALSIERHILYCLQTDTQIITCKLSQRPDDDRHINK